MREWSGHENGTEEVLGLKTREEALACRRRPAGVASWCPTKYQTCLNDIVRQPKMHVCAQYGHIITNYVAILAITLIVWPESHKTSNIIAHFEKVF